MNMDDLDFDEQNVLISPSSRIYHLPHANRPDDSVCSTEVVSKADTEILANVEDHMRVCSHCRGAANDVPRLVDLVFE